MLTLTNCFINREYTYLLSDNINWDHIEWDSLENKQVKYSLNFETWLQSNPICIDVNIHL